MAKFSQPMEYEAKLNANSLCNVLVVHVSTTNKQFLYSILAEKKICRGLGGGAGKLLLLQALDFECIVQ